MRKFALGGLAAVLLAAPAGGRAATIELDSEALTARVETKPFALEFIDKRDGEALRTVGGAAVPDAPESRYGPLGYSFDLRVPVVNNAFLGYYVAAEVETLWFHATRGDRVPPGGFGPRPHRGDERSARPPARGTPQPARRRA